MKTAWRHKQSDLEANNGGVTESAGSPYYKKSEGSGEDSVRGEQSDGRMHELNFPSVVSFELGAFKALWGLTAD